MTTRRPDRSSRTRIIVATSLVMLIATLSLSGSASGATPLGAANFGSAGSDSAQGATLYFQTTSPGGANGQYTVPFPGVITAWGSRAPFSPQQLKFKVGRFVGQSGPMGIFTDFLIVGDSELKSLTEGVQNTFPTRISVAAGDVIGVWKVQPAPITFDPVAGYSNHFGGFDAPPGTTVSLSGPDEDDQLNVAAILEPDADNDGFGDETQDGCPDQPGSENGCAPDTSPPETTITKKPKDKTKKKQATFEFTSSEPGSTFLCGFDGDPLTPCTSPEEEKVGKGKHEFDVVAVDTAGNKDATPAEDAWRVKKKK